MNNTEKFESTVKYLIESEGYTELQAAAEEQTKLVSLARAEGAVRRAGPGRAGGRAGTAPTRIPTVWACPALPPPAAASQPAWARAAWAPQLPGPAVPCARG